MKQGYIKLYRKIQDNPLYRERRRFSRNEAWIDLLLLANHKATSILVDLQIVSLKAGDVFSSQRILSRRWGWGIASVNRFLNFLKRGTQVGIRTERKYTIISILNWKQYQGRAEHQAERKAEHERNTDGTQVETINNVKNEKNVKNISIERQSRKDLSIIFLYISKKNLPLKEKDKKQSFIKRHLRSAKVLIPYGLDRTEEVMDWLEEHADYKWTLETVAKYIDEDLTKLSQWSKEETVDVPSYAKRND